MKKYFYCRLVNLIVIAVFTLAIVPVAVAKTINLYETDNLNSKIIGTIDSNVGIIPIFTPKEKDWIKVADPRNGNVGWIKSAELNNIRVNFALIRTPDGKNGYQISQYSAMQSAKQVRRIMEKIQLQQKTVQKDIETMMQDMFKDIHQ